jgi:hypothetical protein
MKKRIVFIFTGYILLFIIGLISCETNANDCGPFPSKFKIIGLDWVNYKAIYSDTADTRLILSDILNDSIVYNKYSIFISPRQETYFAQSSNNWSFSLMQTAYACSPVIPETDEKIDSIVIVSTKDFNVNHPSGSDLVDLFDVVVLDPVNHIYYEKYSSNDFIKSNPYVPKELTLILREQPDSTTDFEFTVKYYQNGIDNNDYFEFKTNKIVIKRNE